jgi:hypothetical protein
MYLPSKISDFKEEELLEYLRISLSGIILSNFSGLGLNGIKYPKVEIQNSDSLSGLTLAVNFVSRITFSGFKTSKFSW